MKKDKLTGGGTFDPTSPNLYFIATDTYAMKITIHNELTRSLLIPIPILKKQDADLLKKWSKTGVNIMLDSGVYSLAQILVKKGMTQTQAFGMTPEEIPGFFKLKNAYIQLIKEFENDIWGYVEIDFGGQENKKRVRAELEGIGLRPIPVFHPFNDKPEYFDELASTYDRICIGNIVYAETAERIRILHALFERKKKYEPLWIHLLGHTPNQNIYTFPMNSCDSTNWLSGSKHGTIKTTSGGFSVGFLEREYIYRKGNSESWEKIIKLMSYQASMIQTEWEIIQEEKRKIE
ncbi:MAG: hypothetical protein WC341_00630 [Bacteroidales bacterium]